MRKKDFNKDIALEGAELRTAGHTREHAHNYQIEAEEYFFLHNGKKLSSQNWFNCEKPPLDHDLPNDCTILRYLLTEF